MTRNCYELHKFVGQIKKDRLSSTNILENKSNNLLFPEYTCYDQLKDLLRKGKKDEAKNSIEQGCPLNKDCEDYTYDGTPLHLAVSLEYPDIVELLLEKGASINSRNDSNETSLTLAAIAGNSCIIDVILSKTKVNQCSNDNKLSHFHIACMRNNVNLVQQFLIYGVNINDSVSEKSCFWPGFTALHFAVEFRCIETAKLLLDKGADISIQDARDLTPLHLAFRKNNRLLTDLLLSKQYYCATNPVDSYGLTHFHIACAFDRRDIVEDFLNKKIDVSHIVSYEKAHTWGGYCGFKFAINNQCMNTLEYLFKCNDSAVGRNLMRIIDYAYTNQNIQLLNLVISCVEKKIAVAHRSPSIGNLLNNEDVEVKSAPDMLGCFKRFFVSQYTELHVAVLQENEDQLSYLLKIHHPCIVTALDARGKTPLHLAYEMKQNDVVDQLLLLHLELDDNPTDNNNFSHFHISCTTKNALIVEDFIKKGVDINMKINIDSPVGAGNTPLHLAIMHCQIKIVKLLLDSGADFTLKNTEGIRPYDLTVPESYDHLLVRNDDEFYDLWDFIKPILETIELRKIVNFEDYGFTLLHVASAKGDIDMIHRHARANTINKCVKNNSMQWVGYTPLHFAVFLDRTDAIKVLLDLGADPSIENYCKYVPGHYCYRNCIDDRLVMIPKVVYNDQGCSIFHMACKCGNVKGVLHFLKMGVDVHKRVPHRCDNINSDEEGKTPLHFAVESGSSEVVKLLLEHGADVNARDCYFNTPFHFCTDKEVLKVLLDYGADPGALNCEFFTAMEKAIFHCSNPEFLVAAIENSWDITKGRFNIKSGLEPSSYVVLAKYFERLMALGITLNDQNRKFYEFIIASNNFSNRHKSSSYKRKCARELCLMVETVIDKDTTLYDILFKTSNQMVKYSKNVTLQTIVGSEQDLRRKYPIFAYLIILQFKSGIYRAGLLEKGIDSLKILIKRWMSDVVLEIILKFMNDHEIIFVNYAASGQNIFQ